MRICPANSANSTADVLYVRDWAASAGGFYQYTRTHGEMDRAFDRLATRLRRPASYGLAWTARYEEPPKVAVKPGSISVTMDGGEASSGPTSVGVSPPRWPTPPRVSIPHVWSPTRAPSSTTTTPTTRSPPASSRW